MVQDLSLRVISRQISLAVHIERAIAHARSATSVCIWNYSNASCTNFNHSNPTTRSCVQHVPQERERSTLERKKGLVLFCETLAAAAPRHTVTCGTLRSEWLKFVLHMHTLVADLACAIAHSTCK